MRTRRLAVCTLAAVFALSFAPADAAAKKHQSNTQGTGALYGIAAGVMLPEGKLADFNDPSYFIQSRSIYAEKVFGGRAAAYYGDTAGSHGVDGGRVYGFDFDLLVKVGSARTFGYVFGGAGYGTLTFTASDPASGLPMRQSDHDWCWTGGVGFSFMRKHGFYLEASYVSYQTNPNADFIPVVIGFQF